MREPPPLRLRPRRDDKMGKNELTCDLIGDDRRQSGRIATRDEKSVGETRPRLFLCARRRVATVSHIRDVTASLSHYLRVHSPPLLRRGVSHPVSPSCPASDPSSFLSPLDVPLKTSCHHSLSAVSLPPIMPTHLKTLSLTR